MMKLSIIVLLALFSTLAMTSGQSCSRYRDCICLSDTSVSMHYLNCLRNRNKNSWSLPEHVVLGNLNISLTLKGLLADPTSSSIRTINLQDTDLTQIPREVSSFTSQLETLQLNRNRISIIYHGTFHCSSTLRSLNLGSNELKTINPGAFEGNCSAARIDLSKNHLSRFESKVFQPLLEQMYIRSYRIGAGWIDISENPIDCVSDPCHLAWLIRDNTKMLQKPILYGAVCSNGTDFHQLHPSGFKRCPVTTINSIRGSSATNIVQPLWSTVAICFLLMTCQLL